MEAIRDIMMPDAPALVAGPAGGGLAGPGRGDPRAAAGRSFAAHAGRTSAIVVPSAGHRAAVEYRCLSGAGFAGAVRFRPSRAVLRADAARDGRCAGAAGSA